MATKQPVEKLALAVRKNVRDEWESKKPEHEEKISKILGEAWTITTNPNLLYVCTDDESYKSRIGTVITWYIDPFCYNLEEFVKSYGDDGKAELNSLCSKHQLELAPQEDTKFNYGGMQIKDGILRLVFADGRLAVNASDVSRDFQEAIKSAAASSNGASAFNIVARNSVRSDYDPAIGAVQEAIGNLVGIPDIKLNPNFENNANVFAQAEEEIRSDWDKCFGSATLEYFEGLKYQLEYLGFKGDDLLQEGFQDGISKKEILLRVVDTLQNGTYHETLIEDGMLVIQTIPKYWWTNVSDVGSKILEQL
ncbi:uncharacterized protein Z518_09693 [Rhinocladiella mackenziei CBS 650.93]|uniref:Rhinocladiella mackenziei CBS 650.93 unplaced genomic scaffold supercont1.8, whole genome shotgun sequence n=1 Tax=Rhinocladiella mackenziei CBS 650.93 TaxID=1442369 RepID=A0A0D2GQQ3_9EURO|nr:uncharacterized protein Z518_09693 [Rhinocladiella mackenziei CBS 650.93]KIX00628.1 hypothetical protein Z518_09693 [Rhinocladiella mackenziei CBS 650.93]